MLMRKKFLFFILLFLNIHRLAAQTVEAAEAAGEAFNSLAKGGWLVVKVPTTTKKLESFNAQMAQGNRSTRLVDLITEEKVWLNNVRNGLLSGLRDYYTFSNVICVYDTNYKALLKNPKIKNIFYSTYSLKEEGFSLEGKAFLTFRLDNIIYKNLSKPGFVVTASDGSILEAPFPYDYPIRFKHLPIINNEKKVDFLGVGNYVNTAMSENYKRRYNWKQLSRSNPYHAIVKMMQLRFEFASKYGIN
jgi:hypothetical protein